MKYVVYEYKKNGARFLTSYKGQECPDHLHEIDIVDTLEEAQAICEETELKNWQMFWSGLFS
jgi:hypothetical protein